MKKNKLRWDGSIVEHLGWRVHSSRTSKLQLHNLVDHLVIWKELVSYLCQLCWLTCRDAEHDVQHSFPSRTKTYFSIRLCLCVFQTRHISLQTHDPCPHSIFSHSPLSSHFVSACQRKPITSDENKNKLKHHMLDENQTFSLYMYVRCSCTLALRYNHNIFVTPFINVELFISFPLIIIH